MTLRLKKINWAHWKTNEFEIKRTHQECWIFRDGGKTEAKMFYEWNLENTPQTEYRKMRRALIEYLKSATFEAEQKAVTPKLLTGIEHYAIDNQCTDLEAAYHYIKLGKDLIADQREEVRRLNIEIEKLRKNAEVRDMLIKFYKTELASLGWKPSHETAEQSTLITEYKTVQREMGHRHYPKILDLSQIQPGCKLPKGMRR